MATKRRFARLAAVLVVSVALLCLGATPAFAAISGTWGECNWTLDNGTLVIGGGELGYGWEIHSDDFASDESFEDYLDDITSVQVGTTDGTVVFPDRSDDVFYDFSSAESISFVNVDTSKVTELGGEYGGMFCGCKSLKTLDLSKFDTSKVTDMQKLFAGCNSLTSINLSSFDTSKVTTMEGMFDCCSSLVSLDLSKINTSQVTSMKAMFCDCASLETLDLLKFNTSQVTDMGAMFKYCESLTSLNLSSFDTSQVTDMYAMFYCAYSLRQITLGTKSPFRGAGDERIVIDGWYDGLYGWWSNGRESISADKLLTHADGPTLAGTWKKSDGPILLDNPMTVAGKTVVLNAKDVKKSSKSLKASKILTVKNAQGPVTYKVSKWTTKKAKKYFTLNGKTGKLTVKKGTPAGSYTFKVKATAAGNDSYKAASKAKAVKVIVDKEEIYACAIMAANYCKTRLLEKERKFSMLPQYKRMVKFLKKCNVKGYAFSKNNMTSYYEESNNESMKISRLESTIKKAFKKTTDNDISFIYYCGHGGIGENGVGKGLLVYDDSVNSKNPPIATYTYEQLITLLDNNIKGKVVLIMDACYSSGFISAVRNSSSGLKDRIIVFASASKTETAASYITLKPLSAEPLEIYQRFSYLLLFETKKMDTNEDGYLTPNEVFSYEAQRINELEGFGHQTPQLYVGKNMRSMKLFKL